MQAAELFDRVRHIVGMRCIPGVRSGKISTHWMRCKPPGSARATSPTACTGSTLPSTAPTTLAH